MTTSYEHVRLSDLSVPSWDPDAASDERNGLGGPPMRVLFLWPFARPMNLRAEVVGHGWATIGPVHLLLRPGLGVVRQSHDDLATVVEHLDHLDDRVGSHKVPQLRFGDGVWGRSHGYPVHPLAVGSAIWQDVLRILVRRCELFVADLTAKRAAEGLSFELSTLFASVEPKRIALLVDEAQADVELCTRMVLDAWRAAGGDPGHLPVPIMLYDSQDPAYVRAAFRGALRGGATIPIAAKALAHLGW